MHQHRYLLADYHTIDTMLSQSGKFQKENKI